MSKGVLLFAHNNSDIDYVKQAIFCASRIKRFLGLQVSLVTSSVDYAKSIITDEIDNIIEVDLPKSNNSKTFRDGLYAQKKLPWNNSGRAMCYDLSPYEQTIVMDTDFIVNSDNLLKCFDSGKDLLINKSWIDVKHDRITTMQRITDTGVAMYWATVFYFTKSTKNKILFDTILHIQENYDFYRLKYKIVEAKFRNDFAFSIALHILNGFSPLEDISIPGNLWQTLDKDILMDMQDTAFLFLLEKDSEYFPARIKDTDIHIMNKYSLGRCTNV